ncbi:hypothetical protein [Amycolatopsis sp. cmx-11-12]|uniref:hypothetical protein n=1 Tax=Amycolatopsis sp. cmx-11-12 TaxID=2785795 RepID=UPI003917EB0A
MSIDTATAEVRPIVLKVLLRGRHLQSYRAFCREYDKVAEQVDKTLRGGHPSKAQFYRWLSGHMVGLPYADHCRILEGMLPGWQVEQLFEPHDGGIEFVPEPPSASPELSAPVASEPVSTHANQPSDMVALYAHRANVPKQLWMDLLTGAQERIDLFANASLFLPEDNPEAIQIIKNKAKSGVKIRILLGDPEQPAMELRGKEERLFEGLVGRIRMALAYYRPLVGIDGIDFRLHGTSLYNSVFRYDDQMLVNQHIYGTYGYIAPILHLQKAPEGDLFDTYMKSLNLVWDEEAYDIRDARTEQ